MELTTIWPKLTIQDLEVWGQIERWKAVRSGLGSVSALGMEEQQ